MTALPTIAYLRRHALPAHYLDRIEPDRAGPFGPRPRLVASWHIGAQGRPVCRWTIVTRLVAADPDPG